MNNPSVIAVKNSPPTNGMPPRQWSISKTEILLFVVVFTALVAFHLTISFQTSGPMVLDDEVGYLANAAYMTGKDWSDAVDSVYYAFGYSLFLWPLFLLFENGRTIYHGALVVNSVCASSIFVVSYLVGKRYAPNAKKWLIALAAIAVALYPSVLVYTQTALSETLLVSMYWLSVLFSFSLRQQRSVTYVGFGLLSIFLYAVHQRAICIVTAASLVVLLLWYRKQTSTKLAGLFFGIVIPGGVFVHGLHRFFKNDVWGAGVQYGMSNRVSGVFSNLEGISAWVQTACGQLFYIGVATLLLAFIGIGILFTDLQRYKNQDDSPGVTSASFYMGLSFFFMFLLSVTFCYKGTANFIVYGRYNEAVLGPLLLLGVLAAGNQLRQKLSWLTVSVTIATLFVVALPVYFSEKLLSGPTFSVQTIGLSLFRQVDGDIAIWQAFFGTIFISLLAFIIFRRHAGIAIGLCIAIFLITALEGIRYHIFAGAEVWKKMTNITGWLQQYNPAEPVFFLSRGGWQQDLTKKRYQVWLLEKPVKTIRNIAEAKENNAVFLITSRKDLNKELPEARVLAIEKNGSFLLWCLSAKRWDELEQQGIVDETSSAAQGPSFPDNSLPSSAYKSQLTILGNAPLSVSRPSAGYLWAISSLEMVENASGIHGSIKQAIGDPASMRLRVKHVGAESPWTELIRLGIIWQPGNGSGEWLGQQRAALPEMLQPGEETDLNLILDPIDKEGRALPPGQYIVVIDLVHERVSWFHARGNIPIKILVQVVSPH